MKHKNFLLFTAILIACSAMAVDGVNIMASGLKSTNNGDGTMSIEFVLNTDATSIEVEFFDENGDLVALVAPNDASLLSAGAHQTTITIPNDDLAPGGTYTWGIHAYAGATVFENKLPVDDPRYVYYFPQDVVVDNSFESPYFGRIYVSESTDGQSDGASVTSQNQTRGIYIYDNLLNLLGNNSESALFGYDGNIGGSRTWRGCFKRLTIDEAGYVYVASRDTIVKGVYRMDPAHPENDFVQVLTGSYTVDALEVVGDNLYTIENLQGTPDGMMNTYDITTIPVGNPSETWSIGELNLFNPDVSIRSDHRGGFWIIQHRYSLDSYPALTHLTKRGVRDFQIDAEHNTDLLSNADSGLTYRGTMGVSVDGSMIAVSSNRRAVVFSVAWSDEGIPSLTKLCETPIIGNNIDGIAFDAADNLYVASTSAEQFHMYPIAKEAGENNSRVLAATKYNFKKVAYELNGGVTNDYGWKSVDEMFAAFMTESGATDFLTLAEYKALEEPLGVPSGICIKLTNPENAFANAEKWGWLKSYIESVHAAHADDGASNLPENGAGAAWRYAVGAFFADWQRFTWPKSADFTACGAGTIAAYQPVWQHGFVNPTTVNAEWTLNAPYKAGFTFDGWYAQADFSGERVTSIDANTSGTLYAKWVEYIPTLAEVIAMADNTDTKAKGVVTYVNGRNVYIQDASAGLLLYMKATPTFAVGQEIVVTGKKVTYGGAPEITQVEEVRAEDGTLPNPIAFESLSYITREPLKYFGQLVSFKGLSIVSYDSHNFPSLTDGVDTLLCYKMPLEQTDFPVGSRVNITAIVGYFNGIQLTGDPAGIVNVSAADHDNYQYPARGAYGEYTLENKWIYSNVKGNYSENMPALDNYSRGMAAYNGKMYFINRYIGGLTVVDGATGKMLDPIIITGDHLFQKYDAESDTWKDDVILKFNDVKFDNAGHCLITACASNNQGVYVYVVDLATGVATELINEHLYDNPDFYTDEENRDSWRMDAIGVYGDVTGRAVVMFGNSMNADLNAAYKWDINNGVAGAAERIDLVVNAEDESYLLKEDGSVYTENSSICQVFPVDFDYFYWDHHGCYPSLFDMDGSFVEDLKSCPTGVSVANNAGDTCIMNTGHNGVVEFKVGNEYFLLMAATNTIGNPTSAFALYKFANANKYFSEITPMWYFPNEGMGTRTNGYRSAIPSVEVNGNKATIYVYTGNNGYAAYEFTNIAAGVNPCGAQGDNLTWILSSDSILTISGSGEMMDYEQRMTPWYKYRDIIKEVVVEDGATSIGSAAFFDCSNLTSVTIPNSVTIIGGGAFNGCSSLTSIVIPNNVISIGKNAFEGCSGLTSVVWNAKNCWDFTFLKTPFYNNDWYPYFDIRGQITSFTFGEEVEYIPANLCNGLTSLTSISIPNSVTSLGENAFYGCSGLTSVDFGNGVTNIGNSAFCNCSGLISLTLPGSVTSIGNSAFINCISLSSVTIPNSVTSIGNDAFNICSNLTSVSAPALIFEIDESGWTYFSHSLQSVTLVSGELTYNVLGVLARSYKTLRSLDVSAVSNTELDDEAFKGFYNLQTLVLPNYLTKIGYMAIAECVKLQSASIPAYVTEIGDRAFENCRSITSVTFEGDALTSIGSWAFFQCLKLQDIVIPEGVTAIGDAAFYGCAYLANVDVPASVQAIGDNAFALCSKMTKMQVRAAVPPSIASKTFDEVSREMPVYVPQNSVNAYKADPLWGEMNIIGVDEQWDAVDNVTTTTAPTKQLINGQLYILRGNKTYSAQGQEVK